MDTVRRDYTGIGGMRPSPTPTLDRVASHGTVFTDVWATGPWTVPSHASIFSGLLPSSHQCTGLSNRFDVASPTFAEVAVETGYEAVAFYSNPWLTDRLTGMLRGFEQHCSEPEDSRDIFSRGDQGGPETMANVEAWLERRDRSRPFLLFVNFLEPHLPYDPPEAYRRKYMSDVPLNERFETAWALEFNAGMIPAEQIDFERTARLYAGDVSAADAYAGRVLELVREHVGDDDTVIMITSDHGENLGDHGYMDHQFGVFETLVEVPLVVSAPGRLEHGTRDDPVMLTDIYDTVLDLVGAEDGPDTPHSRSLLGPPAEDDRALLSEYAGANESLIRALKNLNPELDTTREEMAFSKIRLGALEYTVASDGSESLYNLERDPGRKDDISKAHPEITDVMLQLMPAIDVAESGSFEIDEEMREWLRSLGYVQ